MPGEAGNHQPGGHYDEERPPGDPWHVRRLRHQDLPHRQTAVAPAAAPGPTRTAARPFKAIPKDAIDKVHFDTNHYNHVVWATPAELLKGVKDRILAEFGQGPVLPNR